MKDRIIKFLSHENISATRFADEIGVQRSSISHILSGRNNPSFEFIFKMLSRYKVLNADWLIMGNGNMIKKNEQNIVNAEQGSKIKQLDLFQNVPETSSSLEPQKNSTVLPEKKTSNDRKIDKILIFYSDKTFEEFSSSKNL